MMAVLLAGGLGTRLRPYTMNIPKPLLPLGDVPTIEIVVRQLAEQGFDRVVVTLGHLPQLLMAFLEDGSRFGVAVEYEVENQPLGTAGSLRLVHGLDESFIVMNGDLLTTVDFASLLTQHEQSGAAATVVLTPRQVHIDYGVVHVTTDRRLVRYEEKPTLDYLVSTGIYALSRSVVGHVPEGRFDMPDLVTALHESGADVRCQVSDAYWQDIGRFDDYQQASADFVADPGRFLAPQSLASIHAGQA
ncbi:MAG TPA: sugar phosphate nucleotidyltransferase [Actinomycetes bacterium]|nr:sugar phosphate nucleotidyltransferase [Actinomycetes bacterium]